MATEQQLVVPGRMWHMDGKIRSGDVASFVRGHWWWIIVLTVIAAAIGGALSFLQARAWEATTVLQIGQTDEAQPVLVESPDQVVARLKSDSFIDGVMAGVHLSRGQATETDLVRRTLRSQTLPGTNFVQITVRAFSPGDAQALIQEVQNQVITVHGNLEAGTRARLQTRLTEVDNEIQTATARHERLNTHLTAMSDAAKGGQKAVDVMLDDMMAATAHEQVFKLQAEKSDLTMRLSADHTYNTKPIGAIVVSRHPVAPKRMMYVALGALVGLLLGLLVATNRQMVRRGALRADAR